MCIHVPIHVDLDANKNDDDDEDGALNFTYFVVSSCFVRASRLRCRTQTPIGCLISQLETDHPNGAILLEYRYTYKLVYTCMSSYLYVYMCMYTYTPMYSY